MKKAILFSFGLILLSLFVLLRISKQSDKILSPLSLSPVPSSTIMQIEKIVWQKEKKSIFVPYWSLSLQRINSKDYDQLIYFGILVNNQGIDINEDGFKKIEQFLELSDKSSERFLTIRMTDSKINSNVLEDKILQENIVNQSVSIAKKQGFNGLVLNFELVGLSFQSVIDKITAFHKLFYKAAKENDLQFYITLYGDTLFKLRPYNVEKLGKNSDQVLIMAYDFHKSKGNPGPNFPLNGKEKYGYNFKKMVEDFLKYVPKEKLSVVFGLFGYDWIVDEKNQSTQQGHPLSLYKIQDMFLNECEFGDCIIKRNKESSETQIQYIDGDSKKHIVWFEDMESVEKKKAYLKEKGIKSISFWAYSYF